MNKGEGTKTAKVTKKVAKRTETNKWKGKNKIKNVIRGVPGREVGYQKGRLLR